MRNVHRIQKRKLPKVGPVVRALRKGPYRGRAAAADWLEERFPT